MFFRKKDIELEIVETKSEIDSLSIILESCTKAPVYYIDRLISLQKKLDVLNFKKSKETV